MDQHQDMKPAPDAGQPSGELEALRRENAALKARLEDFLGHVPALVYLKDRQGRYQFVNRAWEGHPGHRPGGGPGPDSPRGLCRGPGGHLRGRGRDRPFLRGAGHRGTAGPAQGRPGRAPDPGGGPAGRSGRGLRHLRHLHGRHHAQGGRAPQPGDQPAPPGPHGRPARGGQLHHRHHLLQGGGQSGTLPPVRGPAPGQPLGLGPGRRLPGTPHPFPARGPGDSGLRSAPPAGHCRGPDHRPHGAGGGDARRSALGGAGLGRAGSGTTRAGSSAAWA